MSISGSLPMPVEIDGLWMIMDPKGKENESSALETSHISQETSPFTALPLSDECKKVLLRRGDKLFKLISGGSDKCTGVTQKLLTFMAKKAPRAKTVGRAGGAAVGMTFGPQLTTTLFDVIWYKAFPKVDPTWCGTVVNGLSYAGKTMTEVFTAPKINPALIAVSGLAGSIALPILFSIAMKACKLACSHGEKSALPGFIDESNLLRFDEETQTYYNAGNEPLSKRDIKILGERIREYQFICELLTAKRDDVAAMVDEGFLGVPVEGEKDFESHSKKIKSLVKNLTSTCVKKEKVMEGLKEAGKFYTNKKSVYSPVNQVRIKTALDNFDEIKDLLALPADTNAMYFDEATHTFQAANGYVSGWWKQSSDVLAEKVSTDFTLAVAEKLNLAFSALDSETRLGHFEAQDLKTKLDEIEQTMADFIEGIEKLPYEENERLITSSREICDGLIYTIKNIRAQISTLVAKNEVPALTS